MSYGAILGQTPPQPEFKPIASDISYSPSSSQGVISGNNVQSALDQVAGYSKTTRDTANNALNLAKLFDGYEVDGYITNYRLNDMVYKTNGDYGEKFTVPWTSRPSREPDLMVVNFAPEKGDFLDVKVDCDGLLLIIGDEIKNITNRRANTLAIGHEWFQCDTSGYSSSFNLWSGTPRYNGNLLEDEYFPSIKFTNKFTTSNYKYNMPYCEVRDNTIVSYYGYTPTTSSVEKTGSFRYGALDWDLNNFYYHLHFSVSTTCLVDLIVFGLNKVKS